MVFSTPISACIKAHMHSDKLETNLAICILDNSRKIINHTDPRRCPRMKPRQGFRRQHDLVIMFNEQLQHVWE